MEKRLTNIEAVESEKHEQTEFYQIANKGDVESDTERESV